MIIKNLSEKLKTVLEEMAIEELEIDEKKEEINKEF